MKNCHSATFACVIICQFGIFFRKITIRDVTYKVNTFKKIFGHPNTKLMRNIFKSDLFKEICAYLSNKYRLKKAIK